MLTIERADLTNPTSKKVVKDILSQAINGELIGMSNFSSLVETVEDYAEKMEAAEHADSERSHAERFIKIARKNNIDPIVNLEGVYWKTLRSRFLKYAAEKDFIACLIIQEVMLESFAVSMYKDTGEAIGGEIGKLLSHTSEEEKEHLSHSIEILQKELALDPEKFISKFERVHYDCMTILAEWSATSDPRGHCGICDGECMKQDLNSIGLDIQHLRANAFNLYIKSMDEIGLPTELSTVWMVNLPA